MVLTHLDVDHAGEGKLDPTTGTRCNTAEAESAAQAVHSHYGLASLGQALRSGGMKKDAVSVSARDMERNHRQLNVRFSELSKQKPFRGQLGKIFSDLAALSVTAAATAQALVAWSGQAENRALAIAFESALERYRNEVRAFATRVKGP